jgi:hypothetical protein
VFHLLGVLYFPFSEAPPIRKLKLFPDYRTGNSLRRTAAMYDIRYARGGTQPDFSGSEV